MKKIHTDKVRATFYIDKRLYQLLKRCSVIEGIPMSSIIDNEILKERVGKYEFSSPEEWQGYCRYELPEIMQRLEYEEQYEYHAKSPEGIYDSAKSYIIKQLEQEQITKEKAELLLKEAMKKYELAIEQERKNDEQEKKELKERWEKAAKEFPIE